MRNISGAVRYKSKVELRKNFLKLLRNQTEEERKVKSLAIYDKLFKMQEFQRAITILFYASFNGEVDTFEMMRQAQLLGKKIGLPRIDRRKKTITPVLVESLDDDLETGPYGIPQPAEKAGALLSLQRLDMAIVPGVAFDKNNYRLGRGAGYYDMFLKTLPSGIPSIGLAFDFQIVDEFPLYENHDMPVSRVLVN